MTVGQWFGQWFGSWYGSGEPAPEGSLSGGTTLGLSGTATLTGPGALAGTASVSLASNGTLTTGAAGSLAGTAIFSIAATGTATSASIPVGTGEYPFFSEGFWSAGFFSDGFWGTISIDVATYPEFLAVHTDAHLYVSYINNSIIIDPYTDPCVAVKTDSLHITNRPYIAVLDQTESMMVSNPNVLAINTPSSLMTKYPKSLRVR